MARYTTEVNIDIDLDEFDDEELIKEIRSRGYKVYDEEEFVNIERRWSRGEKKEALILLEREFKWLRGIANLAN